MLYSTAPFASQPERSTCSVRTVDPFTGADLCKHRVAEHRGGGPKFIHATSFYCASSSAVIPHNRKSPDFTAHLHLLNFSAFYCASSLVDASPRRKVSGPHVLAATPAPFTLRAAACIAARLCCRVTVNLHQNWLFQSTKPDRASLESRITGASDAVPPRRREPPQILSLIHI